MSEHITHIAVFEDVWRLFYNSDEICDAFKISVGNFYDSGLLGSGTRGNHIFVLPILELYKDQWESVKEDPNAQVKIAYAIGWLAHRAADRRLKLVFADAENDPNPLFTNSGCRIYQDAKSFEKVYQGGNQACLSPREILSTATLDYNMQSHPAAGKIDVSLTEPLFNRMWQVDMIQKHLFVEQRDDLDTWLDLFIDRFPDLTEDIREYEKAYNDPDPALTQRYFDEDNYYTDSDEIIRFVRAIQEGGQPGETLQTVVEKAKDQSLYAQTLRQGYFFIKGASDYFTNSVSKAEFQTIIDKQIS